MNKSSHEHQQQPQRNSHAAELGSLAAITFNNLPLEEYDTKVEFSGGPADVLGTFRDGRQFPKGARTPGRVSSMNNRTQRQGGANTWYDKKH